MKEIEEGSAWGNGHPHDGEVPHDGRDSWEHDSVEFFANNSSVLPEGENKASKVPLPPDD